MFGEKSKGAKGETEKGEQSFLNAVRCPDLIHTPINLHEDILNGN